MRLLQQQQQHQQQFLLVVVSLLLLLFISTLYPSCNNSFSVTASKSSKKSFSTSIYNHFNQYPYPLLGEHHFRSLQSSSSSSSSSNSDGDDDNNNDSDGIVQRECSPNDPGGLVFPTDDDTTTTSTSNTPILIHDEIVQPSCTCYAQDNTIHILNALQQNNASNVTEYLYLLNHAFRNIYGIIEYNCTNQCEHCFYRNYYNINDNNDEISTWTTPDLYYCGILQTNETSYYHGTVGNFTEQEYNTGSVSRESLDRLFIQSSFRINTCITYTKVVAVTNNSSTTTTSEDTVTSISRSSMDNSHFGQVGDTVCYSSQFVNVSSSSSAAAAAATDTTTSANTTTNGTILPTCTVQYNNVSCNSCTLYNFPTTTTTTSNNATNNECFVVNCTNIIPNSSIIDTCTTTTVSATDDSSIMEHFLQFLVNGVSILPSSTTTTTTSNYITVVGVGTCNDDDNDVPSIQPSSSLSPAQPVQIPSSATELTPTTPTINSGGTTTSSLLRMTKRRMIATTTTMIIFSILILL